MNVFVAERTVRSHAFVVAISLERAFRLFEPEGERAWAQGWEPTYVYPADGRAEPGMVFTTKHGDEATIWTVVRHDPAAGVLEYQRVTPGLQTGSVRVQCTALSASRARVTVAYTLTALTEDGNERLRAMDEAHYRDYIGSWADAINLAIGADADGRMPEPR